MKQHAQAAWHTTISNVLNEPALRGSTACEHRRALFELLRSLRQLDAAPAQLAMVRRVAAAVHRLEFSLLHAAAADLAYALRELRRVKTAWARFLSGPDAGSGMLVTPRAEARLRQVARPPLDLAA
jgi:hypothetical protein